MITNMKLAALAAALFLAAALLARPAAADSDVEAGKQIGYSCLGCHGIDGYRNAYPSYRVPKLGGQKAPYLAIALKGYREGKRSHPTMTGQASSLTDQDIENVAAYLASSGGDTVAAGGSKNASFDKAVTCIVCHGLNGVSENPLWPTLAGQHEDYLLQAMNGYRDGSRVDPVMSAQATLIAAEDVALLAKYFAGLDGLETTKAE
jgi:cytochrome c553